jgi:hypothetical protein
MFFYREPATEAKNACIELHFAVLLELLEQDLSQGS